MEANRDLDIYDGRTRRFQQDSVRSTLDGHSWLMDCLGTKWCQEELFFSEQRLLDDVHPLFFNFGAPSYGERVIEDLRCFFEMEKDRFNKLLRRLQHERNIDRVCAQLHHLHAYAHLRRRGMACSWEPPTVKPKVADIGISYNAETIFVEVLTLVESEEDQEQRRILDQLRIRINAIPNNCYCVSPWFNYPLNEEAAKKFLAFIEDRVHSGELPTNPNERLEIEWHSDGMPYGKVTFYLSSVSRGFWSTQGTSQIRMLDAFRVKKRILSKLEEGKFQLSPRPALGGFILCLQDYWTHFDDVVDAVKGTDALTFSTPGKMQSIRKQDGVIHHPKGENLSLVDFIVVVENPRENWTKKNMRFLHNEQGLLTRKEVIGLFLDAEQEVE